MTGTQTLGARSQCFCYSKSDLPAQEGPCCRCALPSAHPGWSPPSLSPSSGMGRHRTGAAVLATLSLRYRVRNNLSPDCKSIICCAAATGTAPPLQGAKFTCSSISMVPTGLTVDLGVLWTLSWGRSWQHQSEPCTSLPRSKRSPWDTVPDCWELQVPLSYIGRHGTIWLLRADHLPPLFSNSISSPRLCNGRAAGGRRPANTSVEKRGWCPGRCCPWPPVPPPLAQPP